ncbi:hypothetical protein CPB83DRAFT_54416 [Crepidotus variabilis]|uniref:Uncharacterized protein n=1 Tax=Crepidotus variabilis TaxID=179855 RepID=A0A9P6EMV2_9AGAR|nr:hypothetical protein CPB83DRAFT_54416 [Crepidotus variabilis]
MTTTSPRVPGTPRRTGPSPAPISTTLARGATARSAASPRPASVNSGVNRRSSVLNKSTPSPAPAPVNGDAHEALSVSLKEETDKKEQLLVQLQDKDQLITNYTAENDKLTSALSTAETRLTEFYAEQARWEMEMSQRMDISEKLREQVRELEKEKRDIQRRYNEQTATFESERQSFYDNEQHLKSRIQTLSQQARKRTESNATRPEPEPEHEPDTEEDRPSSPQPNGEKSEVSKQDFNDPESEPAEMTALKLELSTLSTSYASLQSTLILLQTQLVDLKRVNQEVQEENESYMILLRERTLSGQYDVHKQVGGTGSATDEDSDDGVSVDTSSMRSRTRSTLDIVEEEPFEGLDSELLVDGSDSDMPQRGGRHHGRPERKRTNSSHGGQGESLAGLPITGPGLDLAAELGRAENKDILAEDPTEDADKQFAKSKRGKKENKLHHSQSTNFNDIEALRTEVKSLKDANKALSLYASKIIDRIIAQEGFEHVLAVDYDNDPATPSTATPMAKSKSLPAPSPKPKQRPQSVNFGQSSSGFEAKLPSPPPTNRPNPKAQRRSLSFDWKSFSLFSGDKKPEPPSNLRPLTLKPGAVPVTSNFRKLDNVEDEEDRKERERLHATMKLMGIQPQPSPSIPPSPVPPQIERAASSPVPSSAKPNRRFSLFGSRTPATDSDNGSIHSAPSLNRAHSNPISDLTEEALERAEAEQSLAVLDAKERGLTVEIAKGSGGGFTEIARRSSRRSRKSGGSSGSTVFSAGMSGDGHD